MQGSQTEDQRLRLVTGVEPPGLTVHDKRPVTWAEWELSPPATHITHECERCKYTGLPAICLGTLDPLPGEMFTVPDDTHPGQTREVPAWPIVRLYAVRCPTCARLAIYDMYPTGFCEVPFDRGEQATLF